MSQERAPQASRAFSRRDVLKGIAVAGAAATLGSAAGVAGATARRAPQLAHPATSLTAMSYQLGWIPNAEFAGTWIALDKGYFAKAGVDVTVIPGGPTTAPAAIVEAGTALVTIADPIVTATAVKQGGQLSIIGAQYQKSPYCLTSLAKNPIRTPHDMIGRKIGLAASDEPIWHAFLQLNKIAPSQVPTVPIQFDPVVLVEGECEGIVAFSYEQSSELAQQGVATSQFLFADYGFRIMWNTYIVLTSSLQDSVKRQALTDFLYGEALGWRDQMKNPAEGAALAVEKYGKSLKLSLPEQTREADGAKALIDTPISRSQGLFVMQPSLISSALSLLKVLGLSLPRATFDTSLLAEMHKQHPDVATLSV